MKTKDLADWKDFFLAAITGFCTLPRIQASAIITLASEVADEALSEYQIRREESK